jgi:hypothetical protein
MVEGSGKARFSENAESALSYQQGLNLVSKEQWRGRCERCFGVTVTTARVIASLTSISP